MTHSSNLVRDQPREATICEKLTKPPDEDAWWQREKFVAQTVAVFIDQRPGTEAMRKRRTKLGDIVADKSREGE